MYPSFIEWQKQKAKPNLKNEFVAAAAPIIARAAGAGAAGAGAGAGTAAAGQAAKGVMPQVGAAAGQMPQQTQTPAQQQQPQNQQAQQQAQAQQQQPQQQPQQDGMLKKTGQAVGQAASAVGNMMTNTSVGMDNPQFSGQRGAMGMSKMGGRGRGRFREFVESQKEGK